MRGILFHAWVNKRKEGNRADGSISDKYLVQLMRLTHRETFWIHSWQDKPRWKFTVNPRRGRTRRINQVQWYFPNCRRLSLLVGFLETFRCRGYLSHLAYVTAIIIAVFVHEQRVARSPTPPPPPARTRDFVCMHAEIEDSLHNERPKSTRALAWKKRPPKISVAWHTADVKQPPTAGNTRSHPHPRFGTLCTGWCFYIIPFLQKERRTRVKQLLRYNRIPYQLGTRRKLGCGTIPLCNPLIRAH